MNNSKKNRVEEQNNNQIKFLKFDQLAFTLLFCSIFVIQCTSTKPTNNSSTDLNGSAAALSIQIPPLELNKVNSFQDLYQLTSEGINDQVHVAASGLKIIYIAQKKSKHDHTQIYEMDLKTKSERRITFQDGYLTSPILLNENQIAYSSSTDEIKENPHFAKKQDHNLQEIYLSDRFGYQIQRVTKRPGLDSQVAHSQYLDQYLYFVVNKDNKSWIQRFDRTTSESVVYLQSESDNLSLPKFSPNGKKMAWLSQNIKTNNYTLQFGDLTSNHLVLKKSIIYFNLPMFQIQNLNWSDDQRGIWINGKSVAQQMYQLYYYSLKENCLKQLTQENFNVKDVQDIPFSQGLIIFSLSHDVNSQIFTAKRPDPESFKCLEIPKS